MVFKIKSPCMMRQLKVKKKYILDHIKLSQINLREKNVCPFQIIKYLSYCIFSLKQNQTVSS